MSETQRPSGSPSAGSTSEKDSHESGKTGESTGKPGSEKAGGGSSQDADRKGDASQKR